MVTRDMHFDAVTMLPSSAAVRLAEVMHGLSSPVRLRILTALRQSSLTVTQLCDAVGAGQTAVSNHLRLMRELGLVSGNRDGRNVRYDLYDDHVMALLDGVLGHLAYLPTGVETSPLDK